MPDHSIKSGSSPMASAIVAKSDFFPPDYSGALPYHPAYWATPSSCSSHAASPSQLHRSPSDCPGGRAPQTPHNSRFPPDYSGALPYHPAYWATPSSCSSHAASPSQLHRPADCRTGGSAFRL